MNSHQPTAFQPPPGERSNFLTSDGVYFDFLNPGRNHFTIDAIAHGLSHICRFTGQCREFYSVAQHSWWVSHLVPEQHALHGLLHDAAEAFIGDVSSPLKHLLRDYRLIEKGVEAAIFSRYGLPAILPPEVKHADLIMLASERRDLMPAHDDEWACLHNVGAIPVTIMPLPPDTAKRLFLHRFEELTSPAAARPQESDLTPASVEEAG